MLERLDGWSWNTLDSQWQDNYQRLVEFTQEHGHARPPQKHPILGVWTSVQRKAYNKKQLSEERSSLLEKLPGWVWDSFASSWQENYQNLIEFTKENRHARPPLSHPILGNWVTVQRREYNANQLSEERASLLERLDGWSWNTLDSQWQDNYQRLVEFTQENGHARPPSAHQDLGKWIARQRMAYSRQQLSIERCALLEKLLGWVWSAK